MATLNEQISQLESLISMTKHDITSLNAGTKRAATDARKRLSQISKLAISMRGECLTAQKAIPVRGRKGKVVVDDPMAGDDVDDLSQSVQGLNTREPSPVKKKVRGRKVRA